MSELPQGWAATQLGELALSIVGGGTPSKSNVDYFRGTVPFMTVKDMHARFILDTQDHITEEALADSASRLIPADTLVVASRMSLGKIARPTVPVAINQDLKAIFLHEGIDKSYVEYAWRAKESDIQGMGTGTTVKGIRLEDIRGLDIALAPSGEQTRIANQLDTLLARVQACNDRFDAIPALLKRFRQTVLSAATSGQLTEDWRVTCPASESAQTLLLKLKKTRSSAIDAAPRNFSEPFSLPSSWQWTNLQFLMSPDETFCYGVVQPGLDDPKGVLLIRAGDLKKGTVDLTNLRRIPIVVDAEYRRSKLKGGEILVTVVGAGIGESSIAPQIAAGCNIARAVAKLPIREISAEYVHFWMLSSTAIQMMKGDAREVARPTLNLEQLKYLPVPIPGLDEQAEIVRRVKALFALADRIEARCTVARAQAQRLAPLVLAKAFRGELVPQDPNDEPTSELLARIGFAKNAVALSNKYALVARGRTARKDAPKLATSNHAAAP